jgi:hypothetical protein
MPAIEIPDPLPPAITPDREVIEFLIERHVQEFGDGGLVACTWRGVLHGGSRGPISRMDWSRFDGDGPLSAATLAAESTASQPPLSPALLGRAQPGPVHLLAMHLPARRRTPVAVPALGCCARTRASEEGSVTITMREIRDA